MSSELTLVQQERLRALGQMASGFAHDINNSLTPIIGYTDFLLDGQEGLPNECRQYLQCIRTAAGDIAHMVDQVRQFYRRRESDEIVQSLDLNRIIEQVVEMTRPRWRDIPQKEGIPLNIETEFGKNLPEVLGNESELREAITHLLLNAIEAMPQGGTITLVTHLNLPEALPQDATPRCQVVLEVRDTGQGMDEQTRQRCLEPFFSTKGPRGSGLGLAMVYGMMRRQEGSIEVESAPGKGTRIKLIFQARPRVALSNVRTTSSAASSSLRILCIDDDWRISSMLQALLSSEKHNVEVANGGAKGVEAFRKAKDRGQPFQVVITDLGMPNVDGRQIVQTVKSESPDTPVIMLTGWTAVMDQDGELPKGVDAVVSKPPNMERLHEVLSRVTLSKTGAA